MLCCHSYDQALGEPAHVVGMGDKGNVVFSETSSRELQQNRFLPVGNAVEKSDRDPQRED